MQTRTGTMRRMAAGSGAAMIVLGLALLGAPQAHAQEMYDTSVPAINEVLREVPSPLLITFSSGIQLNEVRLVGTDNGRELWPIEWTKKDEEVYDVEMRSLKQLPPGKYQIEWLAWCRHHYHPDGGVIPFVIASADQPLEGNAATPAAAPPTSGVPLVGQGWPRLVPPKDAEPPADR